MGLRECPCKFRLGIAGNRAAAAVFVNGEEFTGTINFSAEQCFTGAPMCNPNVNNFEITFSSGGQTFNLVAGRRGTILCTDGTAAFLFDGTAHGAGNSLPDEDFTVEFSYIISPTDPTMAHITIFAVGQESGTTFSTEFDAPVSPQTFIGDCTDTVNPNT